MGEGVREEPQDSSKDDGIWGGRPWVVGGTVNVDFIAQRNGTHPGQGLRTTCVSVCSREALGLWGSTAAFPAPVGRLLAQKLQVKVSSEVELLVSESASIIIRLTHLLSPGFPIYKVRRLRNNRSKSVWFVKLWIEPDWLLSPFLCWLSLLQVISSKCSYVLTLHQSPSLLSVPTIVIIVQLLNCV